MQTIAHNLLAQFTDRQLNITNKDKAKSTEKLSSGYRINRAADDTAGLQISEKMRWQIRGLNKASNNIQDGISLLLVADGALNETHEVLQRMRELAVQAANDTNTEVDRTAIQNEIDLLTEEVDRIANDTSFNEEIYPLKGVGGIGSSGGSSGYKLPDFLWIENFSIDNTTGADVEWDGIVYHSGERFSGSYVMYDTRLNPDAVRTYKAGYFVRDTHNFGKYNYMSRMFLFNYPNSSIADCFKTLQQDGEGGLSITSWGVDTDGTIFFKTENGSKLWIGEINDGSKWIMLCDMERNPVYYSNYFKAERTNSNESTGNENIWIQMGAKSNQGMFIQLVDATAKGVGITDPALDVTSYDNASATISRIDNAINKVSSYRSNFGAQQNRLEHAMAVDDNTSENTQAAESRLRDADMAEEMVNYARHSILQQAGQSMLAQANQIPNGILQLLQ